MDGAQLSRADSKTAPKVRASLSQLQYEPTLQSSPKSMNCPSTRLYFLLMNLFGLVHLSYTFATSTPKHRVYTTYELHRTTPQQLLPPLVGLSIA
jgi:hypothetical protein